ncbi:MFS transporter [Streptomyces carpinensis]|uniref:MFS transporter n=1 Tax=Streptomyces carpinensis TaxID=66369 RepID=A0ABV1W0Z1_9ACTN|nr:MFS transporter [Streptomyces carpinensis]
MTKKNLRSVLLDRELTAYPKGAQRWGLLLLVVASGICLTSLGLVAGSIAPLLFEETGMTTDFYSYLLVVAGIVGAITSYFSVLSDRIGRANLIVYGALAAGLIATFGVPTAHTKWEFAVWYCVMGFADGVSLVGTATLMRDFTPQTGRATAMGINTLGTGASALLISFFAGRLLKHTDDWRVMLHLTGGACLAAFVACLFLLRELPPRLRAQVVATAEDEHVLEKQAAGAGEEQPGLAQAPGIEKLRAVINPRMISANLAIMFYLIVFVTASGFLTLYNVEVQHLSVAEANDLGTLYWAVNCVGLVLFGVLSDRLLVRKPIMFLGAGVVVISMIFVMTADNPGYWRLAIPLMFWSLGMGGGFAPWYAAYSEDSEARNASLVGTSFGVFGVFNRLSAVIAGLVIPHVIGSPIATAHGWRIWFIVCIVMMVLFIPLCAYGLGGHYSPRKARSALLARSAAARTAAQTSPATAG